jgi:XTP/dITP diphosphohydrolase
MLKYYRIIALLLIILGSAMYIPLQATDFYNETKIGENSMHELYYVTGNSDKFEVVYRYIDKNAPHIQLKPFTHDIPEIQSYDQREVAVEKARQAWNLLQKPVIIDDAGIYFEKYRDFPGVLTKFVYRGIGQEGLLKLVEPGDKAYFQITMVYWYGPEQYQVFMSKCPGYILHQQKYTASPDSPYDVLFAPEGETRTFAELRVSGEYEKYHYRIDALRQFLHWLTTKG